MDLDDAKIPILSNSQTDLNNMDLPQEQAGKLICQMENNLILMKHVCAIIRSNPKDCCTSLKQLKAILDNLEENLNKTCDILNNPQLNSVHSGSKLWMVTKDEIMNLKKQYLDILMEYDKGWLEYTALCQANLTTNMRFENKASPTSTIIPVLEENSDLKISKCLLRAVCTLVIIGIILKFA